MSDLPFINSQRRASGAAKAISAWTAFLFGMHCISLSSSGIIPFSWVASVWPGASIVGVLTIALLFCVIHAVAYAFMGRATPLEGADYVLSSRVISPTVAFATSFTFVIASGVVAGGLAAWVPTTAIPSLLRPMAIILQEPRYADLADYASSPLGVISISFIVIALAAVTTTKAGALLKATLTLGFALGIAAWAIILWSLWEAQGPREFQTAWDHFMASTGPYGRFDQQVPLAVAAGMSFSQSWVHTTLAGLIMGFWIYYGYAVPTYFAEEIRRPRIDLIVSSLGALAVAYLIFAGAAVLLGRLLSPEWIAAEGYIANNPDAVQGVTHGAPVIGMPWITFYAAILKPHPWLIGFVAFSWIFTLVNLVQTYLFYTSRIVFSWTQDRVMPDFFLGPPERPSFRRVILFVSLLAVAGSIDAALGGPLGTQLAFVFFVVVLQLVPVFALTALPWLRPSIFVSLPGSLQRRVGGIPIITIVGATTLCYLAWMVVASFIFPGSGLARPERTLGWLVGFFVLGIGVFQIFRTVRLRRDHVDISVVYRSEQHSDAIPGHDFQ